MTESNAKKACAVAAATVLASIVLTLSGASAQSGNECSPSQGLHFICNAQRPEDLARIPGTRWLIASGFANGAGLKLVDTERKQARFWYSGAAEQLRPDTGRYPGCPGAPDVKVFNAHGISLRAKGQGQHTLYVVNHGGRQSIDVFDVNASGPEPQLIWVGCVMMPNGTSANGVAATDDGVILATVQTMNGTTLGDSVSGRPTGGVFQWKPGDSGFQLLPGTAVPGNNGLEVSPDGKEFYVIGFGVHTVFIFDRANTANGPVRQAVAPGFMPDNLHWDNDKLVLAGMVVDEPACGGVRKVVNGQATSLRCPRGWVVASLDPVSLVYSVIAYDVPNPVYNGVSAAVVIGNEVWLGSYQSDKIAYRQLPVRLGPD